MTIFTFFFAVLVANVEFAGFAPKPAWERSLSQKPQPENQSERTDLPKTGFAI